MNGAYSANDSYATPDENGVRYVFQVRVVVGDYCQGKENIKTTPEKPNGDYYDSVVDSMTDPQMFVVFDDCSVYPEYLIKFKTTGGVRVASLVGQF